MALAHGGEHKEDENEGKTVVLVGELIDTACYVASGGDAKGKDHAQCAMKCMASGIPGGILPDGSKHPHDMRFLVTNPKVFARYAAKTIKVNGTLYENMHAVDPAKLWVKEGHKWTEIKLNDEHHKMTSGDSEEHEHEHEHGH